MNFSLGHASQIPVDKAFHFGKIAILWMGMRSDDAAEAEFVALLMLALAAPTEQCICLTGLVIGSIIALWDNAIMWKLRGL